MAIFHLKHGFVGRSTGASSVAKAAYNAGQKIEDQNGSNKHSDYTRKSGILYDEITLPKGSPKWADSRGELWRRLEAREDRSTRPKQALLAHSFDVALPHELTLEQNIFLVRDFVREQFTRKGYAADWAIHAPDPRGDPRNIHVSILVPLRKVEGDSYGNKDRYPKSVLRAQVKQWRTSWATLSNRHLKRYGHAAQIDERTLKAQGHSRRPTRHHGQRARTSRKASNALRATRPAEPKAPIVKISKALTPDGAIKVRAAIKHSAVAAVSVPSPAVQVRSKGWPHEAVRDWEAWGSRNPGRFFAIWRELMPSGFTPQHGPAL